MPCQNAHMSLFIIVTVSQASYVMCMRPLRENTCRRWHDAQLSFLSSLYIATPVGLSWPVSFLFARGLRDGARPPHAPMNVNCSACCRRSPLPRKAFR